MATTGTVPQPGPGTPVGAKAPIADNQPGQPASAEALVPVARSPEEAAQPFGPVIARLPVELDVMVPVRNFRVRNLLALEPGQVIESQWGNGEDLPLAAGAVELAWTEFEVIDNQLAVRLTRLV